MSAWHPLAQARPHDVVHLISIWLYTMSACHLLAQARPHDVVHLTSICGEPEGAPPIVSSTAALSIYMFIYIPLRTSSTRDQLLNTCAVYALLVPRKNLSFPGLHLRDGGEIARAVCMDYQEDPQREAKPAEAINSQEVPSICDSADQYSPT